MAWFLCNTGGKNGLILTVTCNSVFANSTITCTDGVTTLTQTCPSSSPYTVTFNLPNGGEWTVSGVYSGTTYSESIIVELSMTFNPMANITVDVYSAANDTVSYTGVDGEVHTITTDSDGHATAQIRIDDSSGSALTFTSSVANDPDNISNYFSKTITLTNATTDIYIMPNATDILFWYGYKGLYLQDATSANGWSYATGVSVPTYNTNYVYTNVSGQQSGGLYSTKHNYPTGTVAHAITSSTSLSSNVGMVLRRSTSKSYLDNARGQNDVPQSVSNARGHITLTTTASTGDSGYLMVAGVYGRNGNIYAFWIN